MKFRILVEYEYPVDHKLPVKAELILHGDRVVTDNIKPLPKGHGRLGDLDALKQEMINGIKAGNYEDGYDNYSHINNIDDCVECVCYAPTIIEADKGDKE